ncbi:hypothetical protein HHE02_14400 [Helicobacter heilmannii]|nr:hypothetical protein HHE014_07180 [Helicobacter heilmannii]CRF48128.1 hypothetical protein HHE02_14400 [Helicobacter heilmannii]CRF49457.1 hypothetical protein HHE03_10720 [Helicobacter heilmannii]CRF50799.1 hypothetical protein HHE06_06510 [Helicobacter heilmannii]
MSSAGRLELDGALGLIRTKKPSRADNTPLRGAKSVCSSGSAAQTF